MRVLGIIPARAGSVRLPGKNMADLGGMPLIWWSIKVGLATCDKVVVSTDGEDIGDYAISKGANVVTRPAELSQGDLSSPLPILVHAIGSMGKDYDAMLLLQPTSPFRTIEDVETSKKIMDDMNADSVISVVPFKKECWLYTLGLGSRMRPVYSATSPIFIENGAIFLIRMGHLLSGENWYGPGAYAHVMPPERSIDIDTHSDMDAARSILQSQY